MNIPQNLYGVRYDELPMYSTFYTYDELNQIPMCEFKIIKPFTTSGKIVTLHCENLQTGVEQDVKVNLNQPRELFTSKLNTQWRKG